MVEKLLLAIDWKMCLNLTSNDAVVAEKLLTMFIEPLPSTKRDIEKCISKDDQANLAKVIHKLHGSACYTGVPEIKSLAAQLDDLLYNEKTGKSKTVDGLITKLYKAIECVQESFKNKTYLP